MRLALTSLAVTSLAVTATAHAGTGLEVEAILGVHGTAEADRLSCKVGCTGSQPLDDEDLESNVGVAVTYERAVRRQLRVGGRASYLAGEGDLTDQELSTVGAGAWARYLFPINPRTLTLHVAADLGPTYFRSQATVLGVKTEFTGVGVHAVVGAGLTARLTEGVEFRGGLYYSYESVGSIEAEEQGITVEVEDLVATRVLITAGLGF